REDVPAIPFRDDVRDIEALKEGEVVSGVVRSIVDFGAFVDIGLKNDGLIHISELSRQRIAHPMEVLSVNQYLPRIRVLTVDADKGRVSLSIT
ncbi:MAG: S1 RNA-binding domain-containing protein, partial [Desulfovermiculus sp.]